MSRLGQDRISHQQHVITPLPEFLGNDDHYQSFALLAEKGDADALFRLGYRCAFNRNRSRPNWVKAVELWKKAATKSHTRARFYLGVCFDFGHGVEKDGKKAARLYYQAADDGHVAAMYNLALMYRDGVGVRKDLFRCVWLLNRAAFQNDAAAQRDLGYCLYKGLGVPPGATGGLPAREFPLAHWLRLESTESVVTARLFLDIVVRSLSCSLPLLTVNRSGISMTLVIAMN